MEEGGWREGGRSRAEEGAHKKVREEEVRKEGRGVGREEKKEERGMGGGRKGCEPSRYHGGCFACLALLHSRAGKKGRKEVK